MEPDDQPFGPEKVLQSMALGVVAVDRSLRITHLNPFAEKIVSMASREALGKPCREVLKSSLCDQDCPIKRAMETQAPQTNLDAVLIRHQGRSVYPVKVSASPLYDDYGEVAGGVETIAGQELAAVLDQTKSNGYTWSDFVGASAALGRIFDTLKVAAPSNITILIEGPTGTGKDLLARIIHEQSPRRQMPFVKVNCAALPENLLESELFGYLRGAFTGADRDKPGRFQMADGGTIFLDEIGSMPLALQAKLLRVLEDKEFYALGSRATTKVDVRIIAACNQALAAQVGAGNFREDLYYRLNVIRIYIPPLSERREDIPLLIRRFVQRKNIERGTYICRFSPHALELLLNYDYPGNVREMENFLEHACLLCQGDVIREEHLPWSIRTGPVPAEAAHPIAPTGDGPREQIIDALKQCGWSRTKAADLLGINRTTLWRRMKRLDIHTP